MGVKPLYIKITSAKTRWGSCGIKNNICFSYRVICLPLNLVDYIVVHELSHIIQHNHSKNFYNQVCKYMPDYKQRSAQLKEYYNGLYKTKLDI
jgi:predicted metal-dependent hydrolase